MTAQTDPFAAVRIRSNQNQQPIQQQATNLQDNQQMQQAQMQKQNIQEDPFASVRIKSNQPKEKDSSFLQKSGNLIKEVGRHQLRSTARVAESAVGGLGNIQDLLVRGVEAGFEKLSGNPISEETKKNIKKFQLPTTEELREKSNKVFNGFLSPKNEWEEKSDEIFDTLGSVLGTKMSVAKKLIIPLGAQLSKEGLGIAGASKDIQEYGKLGTQFFLSIFDPKGATKFASNLFEKANSVLPEAAALTPPANSKLAKDLTKFIANINEGLENAPGKESLRKSAESLLEKVNKGAIKVKELVQANKDINKFLKRESLEAVDRKGFLELGSTIKDAISSRKNINPEFYKNWSQANEMFGTIAESQKSSRFISKIVGKKALPYGAGTLFSEIVGGYPEAILPTLGGIAAIGSGVKTYELLSRIFASKTMTRYYFDILKNATKRNVPATANSLKKLDNEIGKNQSSKSSQSSG